MVETAQEKFIREVKFARDWVKEREIIKYMILSHSAKHTPSALLTRVMKSPEKRDLLTYIIK